MWLGRGRALEEGAGAGGCGLAACLAEVSQGQSQLQLTRSPALTEAEPRVSGAWRWGLEVGFLEGAPTLLLRWALGTAWRLLSGKHLEVIEGNFFKPQALSPDLAADGQLRVSLCGPGLHKGSLWRLLGRSEGWGSSQAQPRPSLSSSFWALNVSLRKRGKKERQQCQGLLPPETPLTSTWACWCWGDPCQSRAEFGLSY